MKKLAIVAIVFVAFLAIVVLFSLDTGEDTTSSLLVPEIVEGGQLTADSKYVAVAVVDFLGIGNQDPPYHWTAAEIWWPDNDCFHTGVGVEKVTLSVKQGYTFEVDEKGTVCPKKIK